jgi:uncharacterized membrane protein (UPF0127 family)
MRRTLRHPALLIFLILFAASAASAQGNLETFAKDELVLALQDGARHTFAVELATTRAQKAQGLMFRPALAADAGMLFVYEHEGLRTMWMKNTEIPLDMLFIDRRGQIVHIVERTVPFSLETVSSDLPALAILELNAGTVSRLRVETGDRVLHDVFQDVP